MKKEGAFLRGQTINLHGICYYYCQKCFPPSAVSMKYAMCAQPNANKQVFPSQDWTIGTHGAVRLPRQPPKLRIKWRWKQQLPGEIHTANVFGLSLLLLLPYYPTERQISFLSGAWHSRCRMQKTKQNPNPSRRWLCIFIYPRRSYFGYLNVSPPKKQLTDCQPPHTSYNSNR